MINLPGTRPLLDPADFKGLGDTIKGEDQQMACQSKMKDSNIQASFTAMS